MKYSIKKVIIFGLNDYAELAAYYLEHDGIYKVSGFTVHQKFVGESAAIAFETIKDSHPPEKFNLFAPLRDNQLRRLIYEAGKKMGYNFISYVSGNAIVNGKAGENCFVQEFNNIQPFATIGNNCVLWAGNHIGHHSVIEDDVTITSHVVISGHCRIGSGCYIGVNATIRDGIIIAPNIIIGQGANVVRNIDQSGTYVGNPARRVDV